MDEITAEHMLMVCGPSGVGKSTLVRHILAQRPTATLSVSFTTRARRGQEEDGVHYHFVSRETFEGMVAEQVFVEWAEVHGNLYGTTRTTIEKAREAGRDVIFDIDYQGAQQLKSAYPRAWGVLIAPPSLAVLDGRLRGRGTDAAEVVERRLSAARRELSQWTLFDFVVVNDALEKTEATVLRIYDSMRERRHRGALASGLGQLE